MSGKDRWDESHNSNPSELPPTQNIAKIFEPYVKATILTPNEYLGNLLKLLNDRRGLQAEDGLYK